MRYLENRGLIEKTPRKIWAFVGDGETDEVDTLGAISLATREKLDNLIFVVNCNLQRLDGPVRGNERIIDELEGGVPRRGLERDQGDLGLGLGRAVRARPHRAAAEAHGRVRGWRLPGVQGEGRRVYPEASSSGSIRSCWSWSRTMTDDQSDPPASRRTRSRVKIYNAYKRAAEHKGGPTVILAKTVKGYGLGSDAGAQRDRTRRRSWRDDALAAFVKPLRYSDSGETDARARQAVSCRRRTRRRWSYMQERRAGAGRLSCRSATCRRLDFKAPELEYFKEWTAGSRGRAVSTTMGFVSILRALMKDPEIGKLIVPIVPDEGRTFGLESAIRQVGIYAQRGPEVQAARCGHAAVLSRREGRADSGGRHYRSGIDGVVHGGGHRRTRTTRCRRFPSTCTTRCSDSSASGTWCGRLPTRGARAS